MHVTMKANAVHMHSKLLLTSSGREGVEKAVVFPSSHALDVVMFSRTCSEQAEFILPTLQPPDSSQLSLKGPFFWWWLAVLSLHCYYRRKKMLQFFHDLQLQFYCAAIQGCRNALQTGRLQADPALRLLPHLVTNTTTTTRALLAGFVTAESGFLQL